MHEQTKTTQQLEKEINLLRQENLSMLAKINLHQKAFKEVSNTIGAITELNEIASKDEIVRQLLQENLKLKEQLKVLRLTEREKDVFRLIVNGYTSKEIAQQLKISKLTVDTHRKNIQHKLEVSNMVDMIKLAMQFDWNV
jgi:DNA-binding CsgD family transcriptional regulator